MSDPITDKIIGHFIDASADGAAKLVASIANRIGSQEVRRHLDAYDAARRDADRAEEKKFGLLKRWWPR